MLCQISELLADTFVYGNQKPGRIDALHQLFIPEPKKCCGVFLMSVSSFLSQRVLNTTYSFKLNFLESRNT